MIYLTAQSSILLASAPVDFRRGIDGLAAVCQHSLGHNPRTGTLFVFINRAHTMVRILAYENNGYWLMTKRLSKGRYQGWPKTQDPLSPYQAHQLRQLLSNLLHSSDD
jgi:transposase